MKVSLEEAFDTVYELADQNKLIDPDNDEQYRQQECLDIVHDFIINNIHK